ncbi:hypothetical protein [Pleionea sp. CnH1-48]|uniref:hypothetical protein n=1 Tax=Pleionea sp. CnH1-48 TaxID=2954494 RepID=UPI002097B51F|nr:hypothetical protein [Pleionea sp. CnH1-48]MCO7224501.1 hypothetical protein [Pleionea sp. CnH1-48]
MNSSLNKNSQIQINPVVKWCKGKRHALIMDLSKQRFQQMPLGVVYLLDYLSGKPKNITQIQNMFQKQREQVSSYVDYLIENGWITTSSDKNQDRHEESSTSTHRVIQSLYVKLDGQTSLEWLSRIIVGLRKHNVVKNLIFVISEQSDLERLSYLDAIDTTSTLGFQSIGLFITANDYYLESHRALFSNIELIICDSDFKERYLSKNTEDESYKIIELSDILDVSVNRFTCDFFSYQKCVDGSKGMESLYIDLNKNVYPHPLESSYKLGQAHTIEQLETTLKSSKANIYQKVSKNKVAKCRDCEYRFVCQNPVWSRSDREDLYSEPTNCNYNPIKGRWIN